MKAPSIYGAARGQPGEKMNRPRSGLLTATIREWAYCA